MSNYKKHSKKQALLLVAIKEQIFKKIKMETTTILGNYYIKQYM